MSKLISLSRIFIADQSGATMIEYSVLIALITVVLVTLVLAAGGYLVTGWPNLSGALGIAL